MIGQGWRHYISILSSLWHWKFDSKKAEVENMSEEEVKVKINDTGGRGREERFRGKGQRKKGGGMDKDRQSWELVCVPLPLLLQSNCVWIQGDLWHPLRAKEVNDVDRSFCGHICPLLCGLRQISKGHVMGAKYLNIYIYFKWNLMTKQIIYVSY